MPVKVQDGLTSPVIRWHDPNKRGDVISIIGYPGENMTYTTRELVKITSYNRVSGGTLLGMDVWNEKAQQYDSPDPVFWPDPE